MAAPAVAQHSQVMPLTCGTVSVAAGKVRDRTQIGAEKVNSSPLVDGSEAQGFYMAYLDGILCWELAVSAAYVPPSIRFSLFLPYSYCLVVGPPKEAVAHSSASTSVFKSVLDEDTCLGGSRVCSRSPLFEYSLCVMHQAKF